MTSQSSNDFGLIVVVVVVDVNVAVVMVVVTVVVVDGAFVLVVRDVVATEILGVSLNVRDRNKGLTQKFSNEKKNSMNLWHN